MSESGEALAIFFTVLVLTFGYFWEDYQEHQIEIMQCKLEEFKDDQQPKN